MPNLFFQRVQKQFKGGIAFPINSAKAIGSPQAQK